MGKLKVNDLTTDEFDNGEVSYGKVRLWKDLTRQ